MEYVLIEAFGEKELVLADQASVLKIYESEYRGRVLARYSRYFCRYDGTIRSAPVRYLRVDDLAKVLSDVLTLPVGAPSLRMRWAMYGAAPRGCKFDPRPPVFIQEAWKSEILLWLAPYIYQRHVAFSGWETLLKHLMLYQGMHPEADLSFLSPFCQWMLAPGQTVEWVSDEILRFAHLCYDVECAIAESRAISSSLLKEILSLCNDFSHRDVNYTWISGPDLPAGA